MFSDTCGLYFVWTVPLKRLQSCPHWSRSSTSMLGMGDSQLLGSKSWPGYFWGAPKSSVHGDYSKLFLWKVTMNLVQMIVGSCWKKRACGFLPCPGLLAHDFVCSQGLRSRKWALPLHLWQCPVTRLVVLTYYCHTVVMHIATKTWMRAQSG